MELNAQCLKAKTCLHRTVEIGEQNRAGLIAALQAAMKGGHPQMLFGPNSLPTSAAVAD
jgi:hypothetical protein